MQVAQRCSSECARCGFAPGLQCGRICGAVWGGVGESRRRSACEWSQCSSMDRLLIYAAKQALLKAVLLFDAHEYLAERCRHFHREDVAESRACEARGRRSGDRRATPLTSRVHSGRTRFIPTDLGGAGVGARRVEPRRSVVLPAVLHTPNRAPPTAVPRQTRVQTVESHLSHRVPTYDVSCAGSRLTVLLFLLLLRLHFKLSNIFGAPKCGPEFINS